MLQDMEEVSPAAVAGKLMQYLLGRGIYNVDNRCKPFRNLLI